MVGDPAYAVGHWPLLRSGKTWVRSDCLLASRWSPAACEEHLHVQGVEEHRPADSVVGDLSSLSKSADSRRPLAEGRRKLRDCQETAVADGNGDGFLHSVP